MPLTKAHKGKGSRRGEGKWERKKRIDNWEYGIRNREKEKKKGKRRRRRQVDLFGLFFS